MKTLVNKIEVLSQILNEQKIEKYDYRFLKYVSKVTFEDGLLLYNMLTGELLFLNKAEEKLINIKNSETYKYLIENWFLVPKDFDDLKFIKQIEDSTMAIKKIYTAPKLRTFVILPTTDCNARCFYCYELGCKHINMTEKTAHDVAKYIIDKKQDGKILIRWFGGEPLCNTKAIDIISSELNNDNIEFDSTMVSNSYLFDEELVEHAKEHWHLKMVQVTLDGTENVYNKVKNYIYKDASNPFKKVLDNVKFLLDAGIIVKVRMNMDKHNAEDLFTLTNSLLAKFADYDNFWMYPHTLYEDSCNAVKKQSAAEAIALENKCRQLYDIIKSNSKQNRTDRMLMKDKRLGAICMADSDSAILISPEGNLGKCEHFTDDHFIGSIYSEKLDLNLINSFKERVSLWEKCLNCELRPMCYHLKECSNREKICYEERKQRKISGIRDEMLRIYNKFNEKI